jgi:hypothetical protein
MSKLDGLTPDTKRAVEVLLERSKAIDIVPVVVSGLRTCSEQSAIYATNQPGKKVTGARGCRSWHVWGRAVDVLIRDPEDPKKFLPGSSHRYTEMADIAKELGFKWGGDWGWGDVGHFEYHPGLSINDVCPDSEEAACERQIHEHNAQDSPPTDPSIDPVRLEQDDASFHWGEVVGSAVVGAIIFHIVGKVLNKVSP